MSAKNIVIILIVLAALSAIPFFFGDKLSKEDGNTPAAGLNEESTESSETLSGTGTSGSTSVSIEGFAFQPGTITVKKGTTVTFTNNDTAPHTVTSDVGGGQTGLDSGTMQKGDTYTFTFDEVGTYRYHCAIHPSMRAIITVTE